MSQVRRLEQIPLANKIGSADKFALWQNGRTRVSLVADLITAAAEGSAALFPIPTKESVGLGNVDNTSDAQKPISTAQAAALAQKANSSDTTAALALKADKSSINYNVPIYQTRTEATQTSIPAGAGAVTVLGLSAAGDRPSSTYKRVTTLPGGVDGFTSADGAKWQRTYGSVADYFGAGDISVPNRLLSKTYIEVRPDTATATDGALFNAIRNANYSGGTPGVVNFGVRASTVVGPNAAAFEWASVFIIDNSATGGENVACYAQGLKRNVGGTWAFVAEITEPTGTPYGGQVIGMENVLTASGGDASSLRIVHYAGMKAQPSTQMDGYAVYCARGATEARAKYVFSSEHTWLDTMFRAQTSIGVAGGLDQRVRWVDWHTTTSNDDAFRIQHRRRVAQVPSEAWSTADIEISRIVDGSQIGALIIGGLDTQMVCGSNVVSINRNSPTFYPGADRTIDLGMSTTRFRVAYVDAANIQSSSVPSGKNDPMGSVGDFKYAGTNLAYVKTSGGWATLTATLMA